MSGSESLKGRTIDPSRVLTMVLAGGAGKRLYPLTRYDAKPMVPFGGIYRLIDIPLSNCINSQLRRIYILTQHKALSLNRHVRRTWSLLPPELGEFVDILPPTKRVGESWYLGTADAIYQNIQSIEDERLPYVLVLAADHVYRMDYRRMLDWHAAHNADVTVACARVAAREAARFGVAITDDEDRIIGFEEKPQQPQAGAASRQGVCASMGIYLFSTPVLIDALREDAGDASSGHDFGADIIPRLVGRSRAIAYDFCCGGPNAGYWRDVGTLDCYYDTNMDLVSVSPVFNLYDEEWPIHASALRLPPAKFVFADEGRRMGIAVDSLVSPGCIVSGGRVTHSVLSPGVRVNSFCEIEHSILLPNVKVGRGSRIRRAVVTSGVEIPEGSVIGFDSEADHLAGHVITKGGVIVVEGAEAVKGVTETAPSSSVYWG